MSSSMQVDSITNSAGSGATDFPLGITVPASALGDVCSLTYTPVFSGASGGSGFAAAGPFLVSRVGDMVTVAGKVSFTSSASQSNVNMTLPISRTSGNFTDVTQAQGCVTRGTGTPTVNAGSVEANTGSQTVGLTEVSNTGNTAGSMHIVFMYSLVN